MLILALVGIGSCSKPQEAIESPYSPVSQVAPDVKTRMVCTKCGYASDCDYGKITPQICPTCKAETDIAVCPGS